MAQKTIITHFKALEDFQRLLANNPGLIILKMGATWCGPCKKIKPVLDGFFASSPDNVICCDIDIDECPVVYSYFKNRKMVNGIPVIIAYKKGNTSYIPDDSITGSDPVQLDQFFRRCGLHLMSIV